MHIATRYFSVHTSLISESILLDLRIAQVLGLHTYLARFTSTFDFCIVPQNFRQKTLQLGKKPKKKKLALQKITSSMCRLWKVCTHGREKEMPQVQSTLEVIQITSKNFRYAQNWSDYDQRHTRTDLLTWYPDSYFFRIWHTDISSRICTEAWFAAHHTN